MIFRGWRRMSKPTGKALVPELRFPEFRDAGEWDEKEVGNVFEVTRGYVLSMSLVKGVWTEELPYPVFSSQTKNNGLAGYYSDFLYENAITWTTDGANAGDVNYRAGKFYCTNVCGVLINHDGYANIFSAALINSVSKKHVSYVGNPKLMNGVMSKIIVPFPSLKEQQKIADCLSSIDELITAHTQKHNALKAHKKGLMQQLFPDEGETVPKQRFPEFRDAGEWNDEPLEELYNFKVTNSYSRDKLNYEKGTVKNIHYGDIHTKFTTLFDIKKETVPFINSSESLEKIRPECFCIEGDIIFADASEDVDDVGKSIEIINLNNEKLLSGLHTLLARQKYEKLLIGFGGYLFKSNQIRIQIKKEAQGAKVLGISLGRMSNIKISYPANKKEQQKIADCLSSIDELITLQAKKIESLKAHKKGLMQQIFPIVDEVNS